MTRYAVNPPPVNLLVGPTSNAFCNSVATTYPTANAARLQSFQVERPVTVTTAYFRVGTQGAGPPNMCVGIYSDAGVRLATTGSFAVPAAANTNSQPLLASVTLVPGVRYWAAIAADATTPQFLCFGSAPAPAVPSYVTIGHVATSMPLPDPIVIPTTVPAASTIYWIAFA